MKDSLKVIGNEIIFNGIVVATLKEISNVSLQKQFIEHFENITEIKSEREKWQGRYTNLKDGLVDPCDIDNIKEELKRGIISCSTKYHWQLFLQNIDNKLDTLRNNVCYMHDLCNSYDAEDKR